MVLKTIREIEVLVGKTQKMDDHQGQKFQEVSSKLKEELNLLFITHPDVVKEILERLGQRSLDLDDIADIKELVSFIEGSFEGYETRHPDLMERVQSYILFLTNLGV
jgi:hypothetical protein